MSDHPNRQVLMAACMLCKSASMSKLTHRVPAGRRYPSSRGSQSLHKTALAQAARLVLLLAVLLGSTSCINKGMPPPGWSPQSQLPVVIGARIDNGDLIVSTGRECPAGTYLLIWPVGQVGQFEASTRIALNRINITHPGNDLSVRTYVTNASSWFEGIGELEAGARLPDGSDTLAAQPALSIVKLRDTSSHRLKNQFYWGTSFGWLTPAQIQARDGIDLLTICSPV